MSAKHWGGLVAALALCLVVAEGQPAADTAISYYVSPSGADANPGSLALPFRTIGRARDAVRTVNASMTGDVVVSIRGGTYPLAATLAFDTADSGTGGFYVKYVAYPGEVPLITGGAPVTGWASFDPAKNIYVARGITARFRQLYVSGVKAIRARMPNLGMGGAPNFHRITGTDATARNIQVASTDVANWSNPTRVEMHLMVNWGDSVLRLASFTTAGSTAFLTFQAPEVDILFQRPYPVLGSVKQAFYLENAYEFLDEAGEWYLNESTDDLYYKPRPGEDMTNAVVVAPMIETLMSVRGATTADQAHHLWFHGLTFAHSTYLRPSTHGFLDAQAGQYNLSANPQNQQYVGHPPAAVEAANANNLRFERNVFTQMAATGLDLVSGTHDDMVIGNVFTDIGGSAISLGKFTQDESTEYHVPYNPSDPNEICTHETLQDNLITNVTTEIQGACGIAAGYPRGAVIQHNEVSYTNYTGISVGFGWTLLPNAMSNNTISYNEIHHIENVLADGGGIYTLSNQGPASQITYNYLHDFATPTWADYAVYSLYMDEGTSGYDISHNVIVNAPTGAHFNGTAAYNTQSDNTGAAAATIDAAGIESAYADIKQSIALPIPTFGVAMVADGGATGVEAGSPAADAGGQGGGGPGAGGSGGSVGSGGAAGGMSEATGGRAAGGATSPTNGGVPAAGTTSSAAHERSGSRCSMVAASSRRSDRTPGMVVVVGLTALAGRRRRRGIARRAGAMAVVAAAIGCTGGRSPANGAGDQGSSGNDGSTQSGGATGMGGLPGTSGATGMAGSTGGVVSTDTGGSKGEAGAVEGGTGDRTVPDASGSDANDAAAGFPLPPLPPMPPIPAPQPLGSVPMGDPATFAEVKMDFPIASGPFAPTWDSILANYPTTDSAWLREAKFGIWVHFGPQAAGQSGDWYARKLYIENAQWGSPAYANHIRDFGHPSVTGYKDVLRTWNPTALDPAALTQIYYDAGARFLLVQGVHHDQFDNWDSRYQPWNAKNLGPHRDLLGEWKAAVRAKGMHFGVTFHHEYTWWWWQSAYRSDVTNAQGKLNVPYDAVNLALADGVGTWWEGLDPRLLYIINMREYAGISNGMDSSGYNLPQGIFSNHLDFAHWYVNWWALRIMDVIENYDPDFIYTDGNSTQPFSGYLSGSGYKADAMQRVLAHYFNRSLARRGTLDTFGVVKFNPNNKGIVNTFENNYPAAVKTNQAWIGEVPVGDWFYNTGFNYDPGMVIRYLLECVSRDGAAAIAIALRPDGSLDPGSVTQLRAVGAWMAVNGAGIYGSKAWITFGEGTHTQPTGGLGATQANAVFNTSDWRFTVGRDGYLYAYVLSVPAPGAQITVTSLGTSQTALAAPIQSVSLLGSAASVTWTQTAAGLTITMPAATTPIAAGFKIGPPSAIR